MTDTVSQSSPVAPTHDTRGRGFFTTLGTVLTNSSRRITSALTGLRADRAGSVLPILGFAMLPICMSAGGAIDYGRTVLVRSQMQNALDSAVLAGGRSFQLTGDSAAATATATGFFGYRFAPGARPLGQPHLVSLTIDSTAYTLTGQAVARVPTPFLAIAGIPAFDIRVTSASALKLGGTADGQDLEVSLMIDVTGSMNDRTASGNTKIADAKSAAKDLVDALMPDGYSGGQTTRVALVPFSQYVNVGSSLYTTVTGAAPAGSGSTCVTERTGADKYTDVAPLTAGTRVGKYTVNSNNGTLSCAPTAKIVPLSVNKASLKSSIDALVASGWTAGHLGTAWAWYALSEKWAGVWPAASRPGMPGERLKKVAVLMTDGDYNTYFRNGTDSRTQAQALCAGMKSAGITVYTVAFGIDISAASKNDLQACASSEQHFHDAQDGDALRQAFQTIAISLSQLRLTQ